MNALREQKNVVQTLIHTGQHYDVNMSDVFFLQLGIPAPDVNLSVGSGTHAKQTAEIMIRLEPIIDEQQPDIVLVYGDVNLTVATALVCAKLGVKIGHVEAGLRSFDRTMPEEINRLVTDQLADMLFTPSEDGDENLRREGIPPERIFRGGNVMIDPLVRLLPLAKKTRLYGTPAHYALVTSHRPANVDDSDEQLCLLDPKPYVEFLGLQSHATLVITDSGGIQEQTTYLGIPCLTMRENTERPITVSMGTNVLVGNDPKKLRAEFSRVLSGKSKTGSVPPLWDGRTGGRIAARWGDPVTNPSCGTRAFSTKPPVGRPHDESWRRWNTMLGSCSREWGSS
jgi:UDP-N-acetylglucosamine 2-epimerase (non-hydrolysing)